MKTQQILTWGVVAFAAYIIYDYFKKNDIKKESTNSTSTAVIIPQNEAHAIAKEINDMYYNLATTRYASTLRNEIKYLKQQLFNGGYVYVAGNPSKRNGIAVPNI